MKINKLNKNIPDKRELYSWGKGFDGQLGLRDDIESASTPKFISFFYKIPLKDIACGCNHSLAITEQVNFQ
jgi:alpha-tubulin suppressor-like RCC1 family protein